MLKSVADRLWEKVDQSAGADGCWPWTAGKNTQGYGYMFAYGVTRKAHALMLENVTGEPASGRYALHTCDNPCCCNPRHLYWGSPKDNAADRDGRKRQVAPKGSQHGCAKLSEVQVQEILQRHIPRHPQHGASALARELGVHQSTIHMIVRGKHWAHMGPQRRV